MDTKAKKSMLCLFIVSIIVIAIVFTVIAILLTPNGNISITPLNSKIELVTGVYSYADWLVCGVSPGAQQEEFEKCFGKAQWISADGTDNESDSISFTWWESSANYEFGNVGYGANTDGTGKYLFISVLNSSKSISLPRGIHIGSKVDDLYKTYELTQRDENGYFYGDDKTFPNAHSSRFFISLQDLKKDMDNAETEWLCALDYSIENDKVNRIHFTAHQMPYKKPRVIS